MKRSVRTPLVLAAAAAMFLIAAPRAEAGDSKTTAIIGFGVHAASPAGHWGHSGKHYGHPGKHYGHYRGYGHSEHHGHYYAPYHHPHHHPVGYYCGYCHFYAPTIAVFHHHVHHVHHHVPWDVVFGGLVWVPQRHLYVYGNFPF